MVPIQREAMLSEGRQQNAAVRTDWVAHQEIETTTKCCWEHVSSASLLNRISPRGWRRWRGRRLAQIAHRPPGGRARQHPRRQRCGSGGRSQRLVTKKGCHWKRRSRELQVLRTRTLFVPHGLGQHYTYRFSCHCTARTRVIPNSLAHFLPVP